MAAEPKRRAGDDRVLPPEIWREILIRLPAKSILRCRSVCKSWYSLISRPNFISDYSVRNPNENAKRVLLRPYANLIDIFSPYSSHDESFVESREHDEVPEAFLDSNARFIGSCNGLICLFKEVSYGDVKVIRFLIWNPTIRKVIEVPSVRKAIEVPPYRPETNVVTVHVPSYFGFGFDDQTGDYKILCALDGDCEIFDLRKGVWRGIGHLVPPDPWNVGGFNPECYLNGAVHWTGFRHFWSSDRILLSFDMSDEIFREIRMPDWSSEDDNRGIATISVAFGGLVHVILWMFARDHFAVDMEEDCSVWAMKEYGVAESWTKLFNIDLRSAEVYQRVPPYKFLLWGNGEVLMEHDLSKNEYGYDDGDYDWEENMESWDRQELLLYNPESRKCKHLFSFTKRVSITCLYEESLVLM